jgi:hypothetical protein
LDSYIKERAETIGQLQRILERWEARLDPDEMHASSPVHEGQAGRLSKSWISRLLHRAKAAP